MEPLFRPISYFCLLMILFVSFGLVYFLTSTPSFSSTAQVPQVQTMTNPFEQEIAAYAALDRGALRLKDDSLSSILKKLQKKLHYYGPSSRPDTEEQSVYIGLKEPLLVKEKTPLYLVLDKQREVNLKKGQEPSCRSYFTVEKEGSHSLVVKIFAKNSEAPSGEFRLNQEKYNESDNPLFSQKPGRHIMRLVGKDLFLEQHGGTLFEGYKTKERLDFGSLENPDFLFVLPNDLLVYDQERWTRATEPSPKTEKLWLIKVGSIDDKCAHITLWPPYGDQKHTLNIPRIVENFTMPPIEKTFKYLGCKSARKWLFEINETRVTISPGSWWLYQNKEWHELQSAEELDAFVSCKLTGELLVFEDAEVENGEKFLKGHVFNRLRNNVKDVRIPIQ